MRTRARTALDRAILGDPASRLMPGWRPIVVAALLTAGYAGVSIVLPGSGVAVSFAIVPVVVAAVYLAPLPVVLVYAATMVALLLSEFVLAAEPGLSNVELTELVSFAAVAAGLRVAILRGTRERTDATASIARIDRLEAELVRARGEAAAAHDMTDRWVRQLEVVQRSAARMTGRPSVRAVAEAIIEETRAIVDYHDCRVYLLEGEDLLPITAAARSGGYERIQPDQLRVKVGEGFSGWVAQHGVAIFVPDANADPRGADIDGSEVFDESIICVPMRYEDRVVGVILVARRGLNQFDQSHQRLLMIIADHAATALESTRQLMRSRELATELQRIVEMSSALSESLEPQRVAEVTARHMSASLDADECAISYWDRPGDRLLTWGYWPETPVHDREAIYLLDQYPATRHALETRSMLEVDVASPTADPAEVAELRRVAFRSLVMIPLVAKGETIGLVELFGKAKFVLDDRRRDLARAMANEAAMALANAHLYDTTRGLADRDPLTGFFNHRYLQERLAEEILRAQRTRDPLAILMLDLDDFKLVNDTLGHVFGDEVLAWVAEQIRSALRGSDVPARYGGDEFAVILPATTSTGARAVGERILNGLNQVAYRAPGRGPVPIGASIGIASFPADGATPRTLLASADARLYRVKRSGGGAVEARLGRRHPTRPLIRHGTPGTEQEAIEPRAALG